MAAKKLVLVRHGYYDESGVTERGKQGLRLLKEKLSEYLGAHSLIFCSNAIRAEQSAGVLLEGTGLQAQVQPFLYSDDDNDPDPDQMYALIDAAEKEVLFVVTHYEWCNHFPRQLARNYDWEHRGFASVEKGQALVFDLENKTCQHIAAS